METQDGFTIDEWDELVRSALEYGLPIQNWMNKAGLSQAMIEHQLRLGRRATKKFTDSERWLWTARLLEQSSDEKVAALTARAFPPDVHVYDLCCGGGADAVALARRGPLTAVDRCAIACGLTQVNLASHGPNRASQMPPLGSQALSEKNAFHVVHEDAESIGIGPSDWVHLDPDRRPDSRRTIQASLFQPGLAFLSHIIGHSAGGSIKLAPGTRLDANSRLPSDDPNSDIDLKKIGRHFIAWGRSVRQQRWWWNVADYPPDTTTVSTLDPTGQWHHWSVSNREVSSFDEWSTTVVNWQMIRGYIGDADGCLRAAGLQGLLAKNLNAALIGNPQGFFQTDRLNDDATPFIDWFEIEATMAFDRKRLRGYLRQRNIGVLEIKVRNASVDPEQLRKELKLRGTETTTLLVTRCGLNTIAVVAKRMPHRENRSSTS